MRQVQAVLYLVSPDAEPRIRAEMEEAGGRPRRGARGRDWMVVAHESQTYQFRIINEVSQALSLLSEHYFNFVVVDNRLFSH